MNFAKGLIFGIVTLLSIIMVLQFLILIFTESTLGECNFLLLSEIIFLSFFRTRASWLLMVAICAYGVYNNLFMGRLASVSTVMDFTGIFHNYTRHNISFVRILVNSLPVCFYTAILICWITKPIYSYYCFKLIGNN